MLEEFHVGHRGNTFRNKYRCYSSSFGALSETKSNDIQKGGKGMMHNFKAMLLKCCPDA